MLYLAAHQLQPPELLELKQKDRGDHTRFREAEKSKPLVNQRFVQSHLHSSLGSLGGDESPAAIYLDTWREGASKFPIATDC